MTGLSDVRDLMRGALASLFGFGGRLVARAMLMVLAGRAFGIEALGHLGQIAAITEIAAALCVLGLKRSLLDMLSLDAKNGKAPERRIVEALAISLCASLIVSTLLFFAWPIIYPQSHSVLPFLFFAVPGIVFMEVALSAVKFKRIIKWDVWTRGIAEPWGFLAIAFGFYVSGTADSNHLIMAYTGSIFIGAVCASIGLVHTYRLGPLVFSKPRLSSFLAILKQSAPVGLTDMGNMMLRRIDLVVLSVFVGPQGVGLYYMVQQLATIPQRVNALFEPMMSPIIARLHNAVDGKAISAHLIGVCRWVFIIQLGITIPMVVFGDMFLSLFGPEFVVGGLVLATILFADIIDGSFITAETPLVYAKPRIPPFLLALTLLIEVIAIAVLSKYWGVQGAAFGFLLAIITLSVLRLYMLKKHLGIQVIGASYLAPLGIGGLIGGGLLLGRYWFDLAPSLWIITCIIIALAAFSYLIRSFALTKTDRILLRNWSKRRIRTVRP